MKNEIDLSQYEKIEDTSDIVIDTPAPEAVDISTWQKVEDPSDIVIDAPAAAPAVAEHSDREKIRQVFADPLALISDPNQRRALAMTLNASDNPDEVRQKIAVAAFYSNANNAQTGFIFDNFDRSMELAVGKLTTPAAEYERIAEVVRDQKYLTTDLQEYAARMEQNQKNVNSVWNAVGGMVSNIGVGLDMALFNAATFFKLLTGRPGSGKDAFGNFRATGWFGGQQSAAIDAAQPEFAKIKAEEDLAKRSAFAKAYKLDELGIPALPFEPMWSSKPFGSAMDEENKQIWAHYFNKLKENKAFDFLPENVSTYAELEKLYTDEVKKRYAEKFGSADNADQEFDRAANRAEWQKNAAENNLWNEIDQDKVWQEIDRWKSYWDQQFKNNADAYHPGDIDKDTLSLLWENGNYGQVFGKGLALCFDQVAQSIVPMVTTAYVTGGMGVLAKPVQGAVFAAQMYGQGAGEYISAKQENISEIEQNVDTYAACYAAAETIPEYLLGWIPLAEQLVKMGKPSREVLKQQLANGIWDYGKGFFKAGASDTAGELVTFGLEKFLDAVYNVNLPDNKKWEDLTDAEKADFLKDGMLETVVVSMFTAGLGGVGVTAGKRQTIAEKNLRKERVRQVLDARINELANKDVLTDEENSELKQLLTITDASNLDDAIAAVQKIVVKQTMEPVNIIAETANPDIPLDVVEAANRALINNKISTAVYWNVENTIRQAQELTRQFPGFSLTVYNDVSDMPSDIRQKVIAAGQTPERVRAFIMPDTNDVYLVANKVAPSEVAKTIGHEIIGHRGIRAIFGADYDNLLDLVYRDHADEINALAAAYRRNPANNVANQRYLTEEFLANCANAKVKPSWWKEFIARIRAWLREYLPNMRFTEQDIEGVLSMASRHLRKGAVRNSRTTDGDMRFAVIGEYGASRLAEAETLLADLATAKTMLEAGKDARTIKLATGWEKGGDGKWRMEIPDLEFKADNFTAPVELNGYLEDLVDAPEFFAAYPALRKIYVMTTDHLPKNVAGRHTADLSGEAIFFNREYFAPTPAQQRMLERAQKDIDRSYNWTEKDTKAAQMLRLALTPESLRQEAYAVKEQVRSEQLTKYRRTLIHEVQHSIQGEEGFAEGSSTQYFQDFPVKDKTLFKALEDAIQTEYKYKKQLAEYPEIYHDAQRYFELDDVYFSDSQIDENALLDEMDQIDDKIRAAGIADLWDKYQIAVRARRAAQLKYDNSALSPQEAYRRTAGEVEARNASRRADMSMDERRQSLLADTADVAEEDKIYLEQLAGGADMSEPFTETQKRQIIASAPANSLVIRKVLYGGIITRNGNTVKFDGRNSHALKKHLNAPNMNPRKGLVTIEEVEKYLPLALEQPPTLDTKRNKRNRKITNKKYQIIDNGVRYTLITSLNGDFRSFYSNKKASGEVNSQKAGYASSPKHDITIPQTSENANNSEGNDEIRFSVDAENLGPVADLDTVYDDGRYLRYKDSELLYQIDQNEDEVILENIYTPEQSRRQGAGKKLVQALLQKAYDLDMPVTGYLYPQDDSITREELVEFYENLGFDVDGYDFIRADGVDTGVSVKKMTAGVSDLSDGSDKLDGGDLRFLLSEYSEDQTADIVAVLRPYVGYYLAREDADYQAHLKSLGIDVDVHDAHAFAVLAMRENQADQAARSAEKRKKTIEARNKARSEYLYNSIPLYREAIDFAGTEDFKIKPSEKFWPEEFSGSFISKEFIDYSKSKKKDKSKLYNASGINSNEFAESLARKWGRDALSLEQEIIDFFRDLKKRDLYKEYSDFRNESLLADKEEDRIAREEFEASERARIEDEAMHILENGLPLTDEFVTENKKVYNELHRMMFQSEPPDTPRKKDIEAMNAYLAADPAAAGEGFAEGFKQGREVSRKEFSEKRKADREKDWSEFQARLDKLRETAREQRKADREKAWQEYQERLHTLKEEVMSNQANAVDLQKQAWTYAKSHLDPEYRGDFVTLIINLLQLSNKPTAQHPEGHRMTEFRNLLHSINMRSRSVRTNRNVQEFQDLLAAAKTGRTVRGVVYSKLPEVQQDIDKIRKFSALNAPAVASLIRANNEKIMALADDEDASAAIAELVLDNKALQLFGDITNADADRSAKALTVLRELVTKGKEHFKTMLDERLSELNTMRATALDEITLGSNRLSSEDNKQHTDQMLKNASLASLMRLAANVSDDKFDDSAVGKIYRNIEKASWDEATAMRELQDLFDRHIAEINGEDKANTLARMRSKGKFLRDIMQEVEHTGIWITQYTRTQYFDKKNKPHQEVGKRNLVKRFVPVEDYTDNHGKNRPGIRTLLNLIDSGEKVESIGGLPVTDMTVRFLRQQLADYDAGVEFAYDLFGNNSDNEAYEALMKEERQQAKLMVIAPLKEADSKLVEMKLSKAQAMQVLLTWEQEDYQDAMRWNGWDDRSIDQLKTFLGQDLVDFAYWMRKVIKNNSAKLDERVYKEFGTHLPDNPNYFPGAFVTSRGKNIEQNKLRMDLDKSFLIARRFHLNPLDYSVDAVSTFMQNQMAQAHYLAWADTIREVKTVFGNVKIRTAITNQVGSNVYTNLIERLTVIANGSGESGFAASMMRNAFKYWVPAKIALNVGSMLKQIAGAAAYANDIPVSAFVKYTTSAVFASEKYRNFLKFALNSDYIKNRMGGGMDKDFVYISQLTRDVKDYSLWSDAMLRAGTWGTRQMDKLAALKAGYAVYQYTYDKAIASGMTAIQAEQAARHAWMRSTDETQQSGFLKDQNFFQSNQGALRIFTTFMSNPIQIMNKEWQTINAIRRGDEGAKKLLAKQILVNHIIVPTMMLFINDLLKRGFDPDNWEDFELEDYFFAWLAGPWEAFYLWGKVGMMFGNMLADTALDRKFKFGSNSISALPFIEEAADDVVFLTKLGKKDNWQPADYLRIIKATGSVGMLFGSWVNILGGVGALLNALGGQGRRFAKWFEEKPMGRGPF